jgi:hypothetical protein
MDRFINAMRNVEKTDVLAVAIIVAWAALGFLLLPEYPAHLPVRP